MMPDVCRSCNAPIMWARTAKGKRIPLDPEPVENGNLILGDGFAGTPIALPVPVGQEAILRRYVSHFATCPNAKAHRKRDRKAAVDG